MNPLLEIEPGKCQTVLTVVAGKSGCCDSMLARRRCDLLCAGVGGLASLSKVDLHNVAVLYYWEGSVGRWQSIMLSMPMNLVSL